MRVPVTIISGYLGAGKTTLINRLLSEDHGLHLTVLVNDFGSINLDANLISDSNSDTIALTNGCVCCDLGQSLGMTLATLLLRNEKPDHIVIEASGISDPAAIARTVQDNTDLSYGGIITIVDAPQLDFLLTDDLLGPQVAQQIKMADLVLVSKTKSLDDALRSKLEGLGARMPTLINEAPVSQILFDVIPLPNHEAPTLHPAYVSWHHRSTEVQDRRLLGDKLAARPKGLYRLKGHVLTSGGAYQLHIVGNHVEAKRCEADHTLLVALGPKDRVSQEDIESWWNGSG